MKLNQQYWNEFFECAEWTLIIQNVNPAPHLGSRNIFHDDEPMIMAAAKKHGFRIQNSRKAKIVCFIRGKPKL